MIMPVVLLAAMQTSTMPPRYANHFLRIGKARALLWRQPFAANGIRPGIHVDVIETAPFGGIRQLGDCCFHCAEEPVEVIPETGQTGPTARQRTIRWKRHRPV